MAKGKYIAMLDDDDEWSPVKIEHQLQEIKKNNVDLVGCYALVTVNSFNGLVAGAIQISKTEPTYQNLLKGFCMSLTSSILIKKEVLEDVGYWTDDLIYPEYDLALRVAKRGYKIKVLPQVLFIYHKNTNQKIYSNKKQTKVRITEFLNFWKYYGKDFIPYLGIKGFIYNVGRTIGVLSILFYGYLVNKNMTTMLDRLKETKI